MEVCETVRDALVQQIPNAHCRLHPLADGGDGMLAILGEFIALERIQLSVSGPLFEPVQAWYGYHADSATAYIEMSKASGLVLLEPAQRNCLETTSLGTGELIADAIRRGAKKIVLGLGGSATTDGGMGVAAALGVRFLDSDGAPLSPIGANMLEVVQIDTSARLPELDEVEIAIASDVQNNFYGRNGAAEVFGRQKGADEPAVKVLDAGLKNLASLFHRDLGLEVQPLAGAGAAGGIGGGAVALLGARIKSGIGMIANITGLPDAVAWADLVITGEGRLDDQSLSGKVIDGVIDIAREHHKPVAVVCGGNALSAQELADNHIAYCGELMEFAISVEAAMADPRPYLTEVTKLLASKMIVTPDAGDGLVNFGNL